MESSRANFEAPTSEWLMVTQKSNVAPAEARQKGLRLTLEPRQARREGCCPCMHNGQMMQVGESIKCYEAIHGWEANVINM